MRIALMVVMVILKLPYWIFRVSLYGRSEDKFVHFEEAFAYIKKRITKANRAGRVTIEVQGAENLPEKDGFIMYSNHQGMFDTLVFLQACPRSFAFLAKKEVSNIILIKQVIGALGSYAMDRGDLRQSMGVINNIAADVEKGKNFLIFPEGTRSRRPNELVEFKGGSFKCATKTKCPIVPCALVDSHIPFDENSIRPVTVKLRFLAPICYEEYQDMKTVEIAALVKARIEMAIAEMIG